MRVRVRFRFREDTGEVEVFEVDDLHDGPPLTDHDARHDRVAADVARIVEANALIEEVPSGAETRAVTEPAPVAPEQGRPRPCRGNGTPVADGQLYERAAACYYQAEQVSEAVRCYRLAGAHRRAADLNVSLGEYREAAADFERSGLPELAAWYLVHHAADHQAARKVLDASAVSAAPLRRSLVLARCAIAEGESPVQVLPVLEEVCARLADPALAFDRFTEEWAVAVAWHVQRFDQVALIFAASVRGRRAGAAERWAEWAGQALAVELTLPGVPELAETDVRSMPPRWPWNRPQPRPADAPPPSQRSAGGLRPAARPRPPAGTVEPIEPRHRRRPRRRVPRRGRLLLRQFLRLLLPPVPSPSPPVVPVPEPAVMSPRPRDPDVTVLRAYVRFATAWEALVFAGQLPDGKPIRALDCLRGGPGDGWWVSAELTLATAREMAAVTSGAVYLPRGAGGGGQAVTAGTDLVRDREWGETDPAQTVPGGALRGMSVLDLVRAAGLRQCPPRQLAEAVLLLPGYLVSGVVQRALDLRLTVSYRPVEVSPLFDPDRPAQVGYQLYLRTEGEAPLPAYFIAALDRDPFIMVCRRAGETALIRHQLTAALPDRTLASLTDGETWVFANTGHGCARLRPTGKAQDGNLLVRRGADHALVTSVLTRVGPSPARWPPRRPDRK